MPKTKDYDKIGKRIWIVEIDQYNTEHDYAESVTVERREYATKASAVRFLSRGLVNRHRAAMRIGIHTQASITEGVYKYVGFYSPQYGFIQDAELVTEEAGLAKAYVSVLSDGTIDFEWVDFS